MICVSDLAISGGMTQAELKKIRVITLLRSACGEDHKFSADQ